MSGRKRIMVDESEWYRNRRAASRLKDVSRELPALVDSVRRQVQTDLEKAFTTMEARQRIVDAKVAELGDEARKLEAETNRRLREHAAHTEELLHAGTTRSRQEIRGLLAEQDVAVRSEIRSTRRQLEAELHHLDRQVGDLAEDRARSAAAARTWLDSAESMAGLIAEHLPHEQHAPGQLDRLRNRLATAREDLEQGRTEAALGLVQTVYHDLSELRVDVELRDREVRLARTAAVEALVLLVHLVEENASRPVEDEAGEVLHGVTLDVDHWSRGELARLRAEAVALLAGTRDDTEPVPADQLWAAAEVTVPELRHRLEETVRAAELRQLSSQVRVNLADLVVQALDETGGYELADGTYAGADQREAFFAKLTHPNGNEIVVDVSPVADGTGACVIRVHSFDFDTGAEADRRDRARALGQSLRAHGVRTADPEAEADEPDESLRDLDRVRRALPAAPSSPSRLTRE
jgi:hypothetical protein